MRRDSSPAAIAVAVSSIRDSGARLARISGNPMPASSTMAATPATVSASSSWPTVLCTSSRLNAATTWRPPGTARTSTRHECPGELLAAAVNGVAGPCSSAAVSAGGEMPCLDPGATCTCPPGPTTSTR